MKNKRLLLLRGVLWVGIFALLFSYKSDNYDYQQDQANSDPYNPAKPVEVTGFILDVGKIREKVVIAGHNFGNDPLKVKVFFNDGQSDKEANVISVNGTSIYCLAPRQSDGGSQIIVSVSESPVVSAEKLFH